MKHICPSLPCPACMLTELQKRKEWKDMINQINIYKSK